MAQIVRLTYAARPDCKHCSNQRAQSMTTLSDEENDVNKRACAAISFLGGLPCFLRNFRIGSGVFRSIFEPAQILIRALCDTIGTNCLDFKNLRLNVFKVAFEHAKIRRYSWSTGKGNLLVSCKTEAAKLTESTALFR